LIIDKRCSEVCYDELPMQKLIAKVNEQKKSDINNFICNQYGEDIGICIFSSTYAEYPQKFDFLIFQGSVATCLK